MAEVANNAKGFSITGMVLGICSIVLFFWLGFILGVMAIIFSAIASKKQKNGMATTGLVTGIIGTTLSLIIGFFIAVGFFTAISEGATNSSVYSSAVSVQKQVEVFNADNGEYPSFHQLNKYLSDVGNTTVVGQQGVGTSEDVIYIPCYGEGGIIWYWDASTEEYITINIGDTQSCEWN